MAFRPRVGIARRARRPSSSSRAACCQRRRSVANIVEGGRKAIRPCVGAADGEGGDRVGWLGDAGLDDEAAGSATDDEAVDVGERRAGVAQSVVSAYGQVGATRPCARWRSWPERRATAGSSPPNVRMVERRVCPTPRWDVACARAGGRSWRVSSTQPAVSGSSGRGPRRGHAGRRHRPGGRPGPGCWAVRARRHASRAVRDPPCTGRGGPIRQPSGIGLARGRAQRHRAVIRRDPERLADILLAIDGGQHVDATVANVRRMTLPATAPARPSGSDRTRGPLCAHHGLERPQRPASERV